MVLLRLLASEAAAVVGNGTQSDDTSGDSTSDETDTSESDSCESGNSNATTLSMGHCMSFGPFEEETHVTTPPPKERCHGWTPDIELTKEELGMQESLLSDPSSITHDDLKPLQIAKAALQLAKAVYGAQKPSPVEKIKKASFRIKKKTKPVGTVERISVYGEHDLDKLGVPWEARPYHLGG